MAVDKAAEKLALLDIAYHEGSLNNESKLRAEIEKFQNRFRESRPSVIDVSTDAEKQFREDLEVIQATATLTADREIRRLCLAVLRCIQFIARTKEDS
jgi:hypothetical protein